jgi:predicted nucleotide-binding protein (sugar kinase/HSP70/actin superfamily)
VDQEDGKDTTMREQIGNGLLVDTVTEPARNAIEVELRAFELRERERLGLVQTDSHWNDDNPQGFTRAQRQNTTVLFGGLTNLHDALIEAALTSLGYKAKALDCPDNASLQYGKEFGNRGQCNPTYFTVGNLLKHLNRLRDDEGQSPKDIVDNNILLTVGACGPCRFGTYITEFRKALGDAGYKDFRVFDIRKFSQDTKVRQEAGLVVDASFAVPFFKCLVAGDVINAIGYRIRPYEVVPGATDMALMECQELMCATLREGCSLLLALRRCRRILAAIEVDRLQPKPKVSIIGEFWAMTTEGDGNYRLQRFLESEGAEVDIQLITTWALYEVWEQAFDTRERMMLRRRDCERHERESKAPIATLAALWFARNILKGVFKLFAHTAGLRNYHLPDMDQLASISHQYYPNQLRGGEGHMEVGKVMDAAAHKRAHIIVSVKPFGCMPSAGVSDGIQSLVTAKLPDSNFCPIETTGDGAVNVYSRVQMALFRARSAAQKEFDMALEAAGLRLEDAARKMAGKRRYTSAVHYPRHSVAGTAANVIHELR